VSDPAFGRSTSARPVGSDPPSRPDFLEPSKAAGARPAVRELLNGEGLSAVFSPGVGVGVAHGGAGGQGEATTGLTP